MITIRISETNTFSCSDLSGNASLKLVIIGCFNHSNEEVKSAASYALGNISLGNLEYYLPFVLKEIEAQPKRQYLLLHSLKEVEVFNNSYFFSTEYLKACSSLHLDNFGTIRLCDKRTGPRSLHSTHLDAALPTL